ncbi:MAG: UDP-N-acetylmuramate--L-alanine ligase, partial [Parcubacteria group bacterium]|nr:UDP-N-acetylmuramate--L-alanine ligase [Parcubacteria group bacterium]
MKNNLSDAKKIYFIGIGGIGMSALARMMLTQGKKVLGSDRSESLITKELQKAGVHIFIGQK